MAFVTAWSKSTGRRQVVPEHFLDNPQLSRDLTTDPPGTKPPEGAETPPENPPTRRRTTPTTPGAGEKKE